MTARASLARARARARDLRAHADVASALGTVAPAGYAHAVRAEADRAEAYVLALADAIARALAKTGGASSPPSPPSTPLATPTSPPSTPIASPPPPPRTPP